MDDFNKYLSYLLLYEEAELRDDDFTQAELEGGFDRKKTLGLLSDNQRTLLENVTMAVRLARYYGPKPKPAPQEKPDGCIDRKVIDGILDQPLPEWMKPVKVKKLGNIPTIHHQVGGDRTLYWIYAEDNICAVCVTYDDKAAINYTEDVVRHLLQKKYPGHRIVLPGES